MKVQVEWSRLGLAQTIQVARVLFGFWAAKASNWTPASSAGLVQRIQRPSMVCFHPASVRGFVAAVTLFSSTGAPTAVSPVALGKVLQKGLKHGARGGAGRGEIPHPVGDVRLIRGHSPGGLAAVSLVDPLDAQGL